MEKKKRLTTVLIFLLFVVVCAVSVIAFESGRNGENQTEKPDYSQMSQSSESESTTEKESETTEKTTEKTSQITQEPTEPTTETTTERPTEKVTEKTQNKPTEKPTEDYQPPESYEIPGALPKKAAVSGSYFDDAVFVGDSVSLKLSYYEASADRLGKAQFLVAGSLGATSALWDVSSETPHPRYKGKKMPVEDSVAATGAKKVYIMLGMNDVGFVGKDKGISNYTTLIKRILKKSPDVKIYVQSMTPMAASSTSRSEKGLNNKNIFEYNKRLAKMCSENGWYFVNVASVMYDKKGCLKKEYCSDPEGMGMHFTNEGCKVWTDYLLTHTA